MKTRVTLTSFLFFACLSVVMAEAADKEPRTGYFEAEITLNELLGPERAAAMQGVIEADEKLKWKLYVPRTYTPAKPAGVMVFITYSNNWGGSTRAYNPILDEKNVIWAGLIGAGEKKPLNTRMMRALLTPTFLARDYVLDPERVFVGGTSDGAQVATILATSKPELFKGGLFIGGGIAWKDKEPAGIDLIRQNPYVFISGSNNPALKTVQSTAIAYREAGIENTKLIVMPNVARKAPTASYIETAFEYLDNQESTERDE